MSCVYGLSCLGFVVSIVCLSRFCYNNFKRPLNYVFNILHAIWASVDKVNFCPPLPPPQIRPLGGREPKIFFGFGLSTPKNP